MAKDRLLSGKARAIVDFAANTTLDDIPDEVVDRSKLVLLDTVGSLLAASDPTYDPGRIVADFAGDGDGRSESSIIGYERTASCENAALTNGTLGYFCDLDAHHPEAITHTPAIMVPAALAVGERERATGTELLASVILGIEVACRVSLALNPGALYDQGFHPTPVSGGFGAAVAAGKLLDLDSEQLAIALGLAQTQASGLLAWKEDPTESLRPFNPGMAARNGVTAAELAAANFGSPVDPFGGEYNVFRAFSNGREAVDRLDRELGETYAITEHAFKRYSSVAFSHPALDALLGLLEEHDLCAEDVAEIEVRFPATGAELIDDADLNSHSLQYLLAVATLEREVMIDDIVDDRRSDPAVRALMDRVSLVRDEQLDDCFPERYTSVVTLETDLGTFSERVEYAAGTPEKPFTESDIKAKFRRITESTTTGEQRDEIVDVVSDFENVRDVNELVELVR
ncbi:MmgE/PrpD family protein [Halorussus salinisoli]|uniref:MmgE/PrpD family protein n=1 Tax=Halorussus salinisoli TaxID=2558242 RepID=UPI0014850AC4|nr:MmgE/PrpD family protein [Halorussus salinisoli]